MSDKTFRADSYTDGLPGVFSFSIGDVQHYFPWFIIETMTIIHSAGDEWTAKGQGGFNDDRDHAYSQDLLLRLQRMVRIGFT